MKPGLPFRLGSTSYVIPADILPNVRHVAGIVDDVELVLFEVDEQNNLPSPADVAELAALAAVHGLTYTVHLPLDLKLATGDSRQLHPSLDKARQVIQATSPLEPWAYVVHLDGTEIASGATDGAVARWREQAARSLEIIGREVADPTLIAVENLENYAPGAFLPLLSQLPISLCIDVGHLLKTGQDPIPYLRTHVARARVIHLHGVGDGRDHRGLEHLPAGLLAAMLDTLLGAGYHGVLTLEVFTERHFSAGRERVLAWMEGWA